MTIDAPLCLYRTAVKPEWLDYNGHMNEAYYVLIFSKSTDEFMDYAGQDAGYRTRTNTSIYTHLTKRADEKARLTLDQIMNDLP